MKRKLIHALTDVDDTFVEEADPSHQRKRFNWTRFGAIAACFAILLTSFSLWAFIPYDLSPPDVSRYADNEYYDVIRALNLASYQKPRDKNNFEKYIEGMFGMFKAGAGMDEVPNNGGIMMPDGAPAPGIGVPSPDEGKNEPTGDSSYEEITDNQVAGVIEADLIKRSDDRIFYYSPQTGKLRVYSIAGEDSELLGSLNVTGLLQTYFEGGSSYTANMFLSTDCKTVTLLSMNYSQRSTNLISIDVSDPAKLDSWGDKDSKVVTGYTSVDGVYKDSRYVNGKFLLMTLSAVSSDRINFDEVETYIPSINDNGEEKPVPGGDITIPEKVGGTSYTVICSLDATTLALEGSHALLSYNGSFYVTGDRVYATNDFTRHLDLGDKEVTSRMTEITAISYGERFEKVGTVTLNGYIKDQYSLDEYNGILRVVTSVDEDLYGRGEYQSKVTASLYCLDANTLETVASVLHFAPTGETVRSVRFDGHYAYVCTAIQVTDPVFFFDLSDLENIKVKDTGNIVGFSSSLVNFGDGYLVGIGQGAFFDVLKIEVYREGEDKVESVTVLEMDGTYISSQYKAYYIDRENQLIGFGFTTYADSVKDETVGYTVLHFNGTKLVPVATAVFDEEAARSVDFMRGVYIDGYFYFFSGNSFTVQELTLS